jgi:hypothetical protein
MEKQLKEQARLALEAFYKKKGLVGDQLQQAVDRTMATQFPAYRYDDETRSKIFQRKVALENITVTAIPRLDQICDQTDQLFKKIDRLREEADTTSDEIKACAIREEASALFKQAAQLQSEMDDWGVMRDEVQELSKALDEKA